MAVALEIPKAWAGLVSALVILSLAGCGTMAPKTAKHVSPPVPPLISPEVAGVVRHFYVHGEVKREGNYVHAEGMTVLKAIATAGGFTDFASRRKVRVTRSNGEVNFVDCYKVQKRTQEDPILFPDDRVDVPRLF